MKVVNLSHKDPDVFQREVTHHTCDFIVNHFEGFMQMYKSQGPTFWLRFLMSFKSHMEEKVFSSKKWLTLLLHNRLRFIRVLNYIYICIHKKFIEGSNTAVKKFINNLIYLGSNSPSYLSYSCEEWIAHFKSSKQLQNVFQTVLGVSDSYEYDGFTVLIFTTYTDFLSAVHAVFEQWCEKNDLSEDDFKKVDSKIIYWLPAFKSDDNVKFSCFEKYLSDYWKEDLQRVLLTDNIHNIFGNHKTSGCCDKFGKEKNLYSVIQLTNKHSMELAKLMSSGKNLGEEEKEDCVHTVTEICMKEVSVLKPHVKLCTDHEKCYVKILHSENCFEPFLCTGTSPCTLTCETDLKNLKKELKTGKFWKSVAIEKFPIDKNKCDASTFAESYDKVIETYLHIKEDIDLDIPLSVLKHTYQCMAELHNFDFNPRRTECLNRLRKKLTQKHPSNVYQYNFSQPFYRESLLENAANKIHKLQAQICLQRNHSFCECEGKCFKLDVNSVAISSCYPFGRVINLLRTSIPVPSVMSCGCSFVKNPESTFIETGEVNSNKKVEPPKSESSEEINPNKKVEPSKSESNEMNSNKKVEPSKSESSEMNRNKKAEPPKSESSEINRNKKAEPAKSVSLEMNQNKKAEPQKSENKKSGKLNSSSKKGNGNSKLKSLKNENIGASSHNTEVFENEDSKSMKTVISSAAVDEDSEVNGDDEIDEILKLIGMVDKNTGEIPTNSVHSEVTNFSSQTMYDLSSKQEETVEKFFDLIGSNACASKMDANKGPVLTKNCDSKMNLKICAYCKKRETQRKMFKKCSKCKEENFPIQHYYCSQECLIEDWIESHEKEHLKNKKT